MASALPMLNTGMHSTSTPSYARTIARFERELAVLRQEEARLRTALARAEALLLEKASSNPDAAETANLTPRQYEIMNLVLDGCPSKNIAADLGISRRTVENHRAAIMKKTGSKSLPALGRFGVSASLTISQGRTGMYSHSRGNLAPFAASRA